MDNYITGTGCLLDWMLNALVAKLNIAGMT